VRYSGLVVGDKFEAAAGVVLTVESFGRDDQWRPCVVVSEARPGGSWKSGVVLTRQAFDRRALRRVDHDRYPKGAE
jgi:hypothetical protein